MASSSSSSTTPSPALDHIVLLVPHTTLQNLPPWLTEAFTLAPGGRHADGVTENKLVLFSDGVYLELIAFIPEEGHKKQQGQGRESHRWGARREGHVIDWANTLPHEADLATIRARIAAARTGITYAAPVPGGRIRPDGVALEWVTCSPALQREDGKDLDGFVGGEAPFWCLDRTPRDLRVPFQGAGGRDLVRHPSGVLGVRDLSVFVRDRGLFQRLKVTYDALQGQEGVPLEGGRSGGGGGGGEEIEEEEEGFRWGLHVPAPVGGDGTGERTLSLIRTGEDRAEERGDVSVRLSLFTSAKKAGKVGGSLGDEKWAVEFDLVGLS